MKLTGFWLILVGLAVALAGSACKAASPSSADGPMIDASWVAKHEPNLRRILGLPRDWKLEFQQQRAGPAPGFHRVDLLVRGGEKQRQKVTLYVSRDSEVILYDRPYSLTDPFRAIREEIDLGNSPSRGPADAPVTIVEYSDFTCGYCRLFFLQVEKPLFERYGGRIRHVFKNFPLVGLRAYSAGAAIAGACAFRQGNEGFWAIRQQLFLHPDRLAKGKPELVGLAKEAGLDSHQFSSCLEAQDGLLDVQRDVEEGERLAVDGTPTFFINGRPVSGLPSQDYFFTIIDEELAAAKN